MLNEPIEEALVLVQVEEHKQVEVDFRPHCHHQKLKLETCQGSWKKRNNMAQSLNQARRHKDGTPAKLGSQAKRFSSNLASLLMIIS